MKKEQVRKLLSEMKFHYPNMRLPQNTSETKFMINSWHSTLKNIPDDCVDKIVGNVFRKESYPPSPAYFWKEYKRLEELHELYDPIDILNIDIEQLKKMVINKEFRNGKQLRNVVKSIRRTESDWGY